MDNSISSRFARLDVYASPMSGHDCFIVRQASWTTICYTGMAIPSFLPRFILTRASLMVYGCNNSNAIADETSPDIREDDNVT